jgi:hypothetical protein
MDEKPYHREMVLDGRYNRLSRCKKGNSFAVDNQQRHFRVKSPTEAAVQDSEVDEWIGAGGASVF